MKHIITLNGQDLTFTHEEARKLYGELKELFEPKPRELNLDDFFPQTPGRVLSPPAAGFATADWLVRPGMVSYDAKQPNLGYHQTDLPREPYCKCKLKQCACTHIPLSVVNATTPTA